MKEPIPFDLTCALDHAEMLLENKNKNKNDDDDDEDFYPLPNDVGDAAWCMTDTHTKNNIADINSQFSSCGTYALKDEPTKALYRLLWAFRPEQVDFSHMYKDVLFAAVTQDGRFAFKVYLHKYEVALAFMCLKEDLGGKFESVQSAIPNVDNGTHCTHPEGLRFFEFVKKLAGTEHVIYPGNFYSV
jgi:hypothetical protein